MRALASVAALAGWIYAWRLLRGVQAEYGVRDAGAPAWVIAVLGLTTMVLIMATLSIWFRSPAWPFLCAVGGLLMFSSTLIAQFVVLRDVTGADVSVLTALNSTLTTDLHGTNRTTLGLIFFVVGIPTYLFLVGLTGLLMLTRLRPRAQEATIG